MASIDDLPPDGLDDIIKIAIYLGLIYILATAFTSWLITRNRTKSVRVVTDNQNSGASQPTEMSDVFSFDNDKDILANYKIELAGAEASLLKLKEVKVDKEISDNAFKILQSEFMMIVNEAKNQIVELERIPEIVEEIEEPQPPGARTDQLGAIEADLQAQLQELESDEDFLRPKSRAKTPISKIDPNAEPATPAGIVSDVTPQPPSKPSVIAKTPEPTPMASAPTPPPKAAASMAPTPPESNVPGTPTPMPQTPTTKAAPPAKPKAKAPAAPVAAQPTQVKNEENEQIFAKSTSIAALRMDMLRELARLKKLINEDD